MVKFENVYEYHFANISPGDYLKSIIGLFSTYKKIRSNINFVFSVTLIKNFVFSYLCNGMQLYDILIYNAAITKMKAFVYRYYSGLHSRISIFALSRNPKFVLLSIQIQTESEIIKTRIRLEHGEKEN